jgi:hypothetical protein
MPFDGIFVLPGSPLARLLEAGRKLRLSAGGRQGSVKKPSCLR